MCRTQTPPQTAPAGSAQVEITYDEVTAAHIAGVDLAAYFAARVAGASSDEVMAAHAAVRSSVDRFRVARMPEARAAVLAAYAAGLLAYARERRNGVVHADALPTATHTAEHRAVRVARTRLVARWRRSVGR